MKRSGAYTAGLVICALLGVLDVLGLAGLVMDDGPPAAVAILGGVLGLLTLVGVVVAWRGGRGGLLTVAVSRVVSALLGLGVFTDSEAPAWAVVVVLVSIVLTVVGVALMWSGRTRAPAAV